MISACLFATRGCNKTYCLIMWQQLIITQRRLSICFLTKIWSYICSKFFFSKQWSQTNTLYTWPGEILVFSNRIPTWGSRNKDSHVYFEFLLIVAMVLLLWCQIVQLWHQVTMVSSEQHLYQTIVQFDKTLVLSRKHKTGSMHDYLLLLPPCGHSILK